MRTPQQWNTPLKSLLKDLQSDNRPTQNAALKELRRRFVGLDKEEQMQVLVHHLRREKSFREWAYSRLLDLWDESFEPIVKSLWEQYHEEKCAWAIIRHFPLSYVSKHEKDLAIRKNRPFVIRRLCEDKSYAVDRDKLTPYEYIWVLSTTGRDITTERAWSILVEATKDVCQVKDADDYGQGDTFSIKINKILYHLDKMDKSVITTSYRNWYQSAIENITNSQIWDWYRIAKQLRLDGIRHPYDILVDKLSMHLPELEMFTIRKNYSIQ
jgi:hypothetical protein